MLKKLFILLTPFALLSSVYANNLPNRITLNFSGPYNIPATMIFTHTNQSYQIDTTVSVPFNKMVFKSEGKIKNGLLLTDKFTDLRKNKVYAKAIFDHKNKQITYGKGTQNKIAKMNFLAQDIFSSAWQMTLNKKPLEQKIQTTNGKKIYTNPPFKYLGEKTMTINRQKAKVVLYISGSKDDQIELGLMPEHYYLPAFIAYYDKGTRYELTLKNYQTN